MTTDDKPVQESSRNTVLSKPRARPRANTPEHRDRIRAIIDTLQPDIRAKGVYLAIPILEEVRYYPTRVKRDDPDLCKDMVSSLFTEQYHSPMSTMAYRQVIREMIASLPAITKQTVVADDLELVTGTTDVFISRSMGYVYQRKGKADSAYHIVIFPELPVVNRVYYSPDGARGMVTQYDVTIAGITALLTSEDMHTGKWREKFPRLQGVGNAYAAGIYVQLLQYLAHSSPIIHNVTHTGVHKLVTPEGDVYGYMTDSGTFLTGHTLYDSSSIDYSGKVTGDTYQHWLAYEEIANHWDITQVLDAIRYCIDLSPEDGKGLITLAHHARTLAHVIHNNTFRTGYGLFLFGEGGTCKTSLACFTSSIGKPYSYPDGIDTTFRSTATAIETSIDVAGDRPYIIDDLHRAADDSTYSIQQREKIIDALIRSATDGTPIRERMNSNMTRQRVHTVKTYPTITGEYFPSSMATSFMRRTLFIDCNTNPLHRKTRHTGDIALDQSSTYAAGLHMLGRRILTGLLDDLNTHGLDQIASWCKTLHSQYARNLYRAIDTCWYEDSVQPLPAYADSIIDAAANVMLGGYLIDRVTDKACSLVQRLETYLIPVVYRQLLVMAGMKRVDGLTPLDHAITELFSAIAESKRVNNVLLCVEDYTQANTYPDVTVPDATGTPVHIDTAQWAGIQLHTGKPDKQVCGYIHMDKRILYLNTTGRDALLHLIASTEGLEHVRTVTALGKQLDREKWLVRRNAANLNVPCNPHNGSQIRCYPLSLDRILALIYDTAAHHDTCVSGDTTPIPAIPAVQVLAANQDTVTGYLGLDQF